MKKENKTFTSILLFTNRLTNIFVAVFFLFSLVLTFLFIFGNYKNFGDTKQELILQTLSYVVIILDFMSVFDFLETILVMIFVKIKFYHFFLLLLFIVLVIIGTSLLLFSGIVSDLSTGLCLGVAYVK